MIWQRLVFGGLMIVVLIGIVVLDGRLSEGAAVGEGLAGSQVRSPLLCGLPITVLVAALVVLATYELGRMLRAANHEPATHWAAFAAALLVLGPWIEMQQRLAVDGLQTPMEADVPLPVFLLAGGILGSCLVILFRKRTAGAISAISVTILLITYLGLLGSFVVRLRCTWPGARGAAAAAYFILTVKSGDIGAYFVGKFLGNRKLAPWVSPGKTVEGCLGAIVLSSAVATGGAGLWGLAAARLGPSPLGIPQALIFGVLMAVCGQLGDLVESLLKRDAGSKDSGSLIPSFGGFLDLADSPVFTAPIAWWLLTFWASGG